MPGRKYRSIKRPRVYEGLRKRGHSKTRSAKIANSGRAGSRRAGSRKGGKHSR